MNFEFVNFDKSSKELLVGLINKTCRKEFLPAQLIFEAPQPITGNKNTEVALRSVGAGFFAGTTVRYNRLDLSTLFQGVGIRVADGSYPTTMELVNDINLTFALKLGQEDVIVENVVWNQEQKYILKAAPGSLIWIGQVEITKDLPVVVEPTKPEMNTLYPATNVIDLNDLNWAISAKQWWLTIGTIPDYEPIGGDEVYGFKGANGEINPINTYLGHLATPVSITEIAWPYYGEGGTSEVYIGVSSNDPLDLPVDIIVDGIPGTFEQYLDDQNVVKYRLDREVSVVLDYVIVEFLEGFLSPTDIAAPIPD